MRVAVCHRLLITPVWSRPPQLSRHLCSHVSPTMPAAITSKPQRVPRKNKGEKA